MTQVPTQAQVRDAWDALAAKWDQFTTPLTIPYGEELLQSVEIGPDTRLLDVAAGSGAIALPAARRGAQVVAVDIAPKMVEALAVRARAEGLSNLTGRVMDGQALDLADNTFDVAASLNGVSLFPDVQAGLAEAARVTRPGGTVIVAALGPLPKAEIFAFFMGAMRASVPGFAPPAGPQPPFQLSDPAVLQELLAAAGLSEVSVQTVTWDMPIESATHLWNLAAASNPVGAEATANLPPEQVARVRQVLDGMLRERSGGEPGAVLHMEFNIGVGTK